MLTYYYDSPIGKIEIKGTQDSVISVSVGSFEHCSNNGHSPVITECTRQLNDYFSGKLSTFELPLAPAGTPFQTQVWEMLQKIPYGKTCTYKEIANAIGRPSSVRAVANAIGKNPLLIIVPCHRVIGSNGSLTGFAAGLDRKEWLLNKEGITGYKK